MTTAVNHKFKSGRFRPESANATTFPAAPEVRVQRGFCAECGGLKGVHLFPPR